MILIYNQEAIALKILEDDEVDVNSADKDGLTPLMYALIHNKEAVALKILERDQVNVNAANKDGWTALMYALRYNKEAVVLKILECDEVNVNAVSKEGLTALMIAVENNNVEIIKFLIAKGADLEVKDFQGRTALSMASGNTEVAEIISHAIVQEHIRDVKSSRGIGFEELKETFSEEEKKAILGGAKFINDELLNKEASAEESRAPKVDKPDLFTMLNSVTVENDKTTTYEDTNKIDYNSRVPGLRGANIDDYKTITNIQIGAVVLLLAAYLCYRSPSNKIKHKETNQLVTDKIKEL